MEVSQEKKEFYKANQATIKKMVDRANMRRTNVGADEISGEEFDEAIAAMMELQANGQPIVKYRFPMPAQDPPREATEPEQGVQSTGGQASGSLTLELVPAKNGYLGKLAKPGEPQELFIFKNPGEFMDVLSPVLWPEGGAK